MKRDEIPPDFYDAKRWAVERLLNLQPSPLSPPTWAVRAHSSHNVVGVGVGRKIRRGRKLRRNNVRIYVERKLPRESLPEHLLLPSSIEGIETDVIEAGRFRAHVSSITQRRLRPAQPGCSVGFQFPEPRSGDMMSGTLGALVKDNDAHYILSNNHVLANENAMPIGTAIYQPGLLDGGNVELDGIGTLARFVPLSVANPNSVDCAVAAIANLDLVSPKFLPKVGRLNSPEPIDAAEGMPVEKTGRATGYTTGEVFDVSATVAVQFDLGILHFADQILIHGEAGTFSDGGDSGSLVVDRQSGRATGLIIGGVPEYTIANHINDVLQALNVVLVC